MSKNYESDLSEQPEEDLSFRLPAGYREVKTILESTLSPLGLDLEGRVVSRIGPGRGSNKFSFTEPIVGEDSVEAFSIWLTEPRFHQLDAAVVELEFFKGEKWHFAPEDRQLAEATYPELQEILEKHDMRSLLLEQGRMFEVRYELVIPVENEPFLVSKMRWGWDRDPERGRTFTGYGDYLRQIQESGLEPTRLTSEQMDVILAALYSQNWENDPWS